MISPTAEMSTTLNQIRQARKRLSGLIFNTPLVTNATLNQMLGCTAFWKLESLQHTNAFKVRGALNRFLTLSNAQRSRDVVAASSGNHGIGVSFAAKSAGMSATIFMPTGAPKAKQQKVRDYGGRIILHGNNYHQALAAAEEFARLNNVQIISSFDDRQIIAGQGTLALEVLEQVEQIDDFLVPIGGGGLAAGVGIVLSALRPSVRLYGVQAKAASSCYDSRQAGMRVATPPAYTLADGLVCTRPGSLTFPIIQRTVHDILLVDEENIVESVKRFIDVLKLVIEPAAAVTLAAIESQNRTFSRRRVACIVTGGNIDPDVLSTILSSSERNLPSPFRQLRAESN